MVQSTCGFLKSGGSPGRCLGLGNHGVIPGLPLPDTHLLSSISMLGVPQCSPPPELHWCSWPGLPGSLSLLEGLDFSLLQMEPLLRT